MFQVIFMKSCRIVDCRYRKNPLNFVLIVLKMAECQLCAIFVVFRYISFSGPTRFSERLAMVESFYKPRVSRSSGDTK